MNALGKALIVFSSACAIGATALGVRAALRSPLFNVQVVEVSFPEEKPASITNRVRGRPLPPVDAQTVTDLAAVPVGRANLFSLDLAGIEKRLLSQSWIRSVRLEKQFPQTLAISVYFKSPKALLQAANGELSYVDTDGRPFGRFDLSQESDLPVLTNAKGAPEALRWITAWENSPLSRYAQIASMGWEPERGFRALVIYSLKAATPKGRPQPRARAMLDLGPELDADLSAHLGRINEVLRYLSDNGIGARQIYADTSKKIVVKKSP